MKHLILSRFWKAPHDLGTFGRIWFEGDPEKWWFTLEKPWLDNHTETSCIPTGEYKLRHGTFMHGGGYQDLEFVEVPGRQNIEIHSANMARELKGCIAPGCGMSIDGMVSESRRALKEILDVIGDDTDLSIEVGGIV